MMRSAKNEPIPDARVFFAASPRANSEADFGFNVIRAPLRAAQRIEPCEPGAHHS